ncbi:MAG: hypothetical protein OHK0022_51800 [Roseiflexaceae bacterium]
MTIFLDTNVIPFKSGLSIAFETLVILANEANQDVVITDVVLNESLAHRKREIEEAFSSLRSAFRKARIYADNITEIELPNVQDLIDKWKTDLLRRVKVVETPISAFEEAIFREIQRIRPTREGKGARDAVIWIGIKYAHLASNTTNYFVSQNTKDFGSSLQDDDFHEDLKKEIDNFSFPLIYCKSIDKLLERIAPRIQEGITVTSQLLENSDETQRAIRRYLQENLLLRNFFDLPSGKEYISSVITFSDYKIRKPSTYLVENRYVVVIEISCLTYFNVGILQQSSGGGFSTLQYPANLSLNIRLWMIFEANHDLPDRVEVSYMYVKSSSNKSI